MSEKTIKLELTPVEIRTLAEGWHIDRCAHTASLISQKARTALAAHDRDEKRAETKRDRPGDRLEEIRQTWVDQPSSVNDWASGDIKWLITEVERLRAKLFRLEAPGIAVMWPGDDRG